MIIVISSRTRKGFKTPVSFALKGDILSGKTHFVWKLYKRGSEMFDVPPDKILYCFMEDQPKVKDMRSTLSHFETYKGLIKGYQK